MSKIGLEPMYKNFQSYALPLSYLDKKVDKVRFELTIRKFLQQFSKLTLLTTQPFIHL